MKPQAAAVIVFFVLLLGWMNRASPPRSPSPSSTSSAATSGVSSSLSISSQDEHAAVPVAQPLRSEPFLDVGNGLECRLLDTPTTIRQLAAEQVAENRKWVRKNKKVHPNADFEPDDVALTSETDLNDRYPEFRIPFNVSECKKIYLDCGSNKGHQLRKLYDGEWATSPWARKFKEHFGRNRSDVCAFAWEPDPRHAPRHAQFRASWAARGIRAMSFPNPLHSSNALMTFHSIRNDKKANWGSTMVDHVALEYNRRMVRSFTVRTFDLVSFLKHKVPSDATVLMKLDIEGVEHSLYPILLLSRLLCKVRFVGMEVHPNMRVRQTPWTYPYGIPFGTQQALLRAGSSGCNVTLSDFDDEI